MLVPTLRSEGIAGTASPFGSRGRPGSGTTYDEDPADALGAGRLGEDGPQQRMDRRVDEHAAVHRVAGPRKADVRRHVRVRRAHRRPDRDQARFERDGERRGGAGRERQLVDDARVAEVVHVLAASVVWHPDEMELAAMGLVADHGVVVVVEVPVDRIEDRRGHDQVDRRTEHVAGRRGDDRLRPAERGERPAQMLQEVLVPLQQRRRVLVHGRPEQLLERPVLHPDLPDRAEVALARRRECEQGTVHPSRARAGHHVDAGGRSGELQELPVDGQLGPGGVVPRPGHPVDLVRDAAHPHRQAHAPVQHERHADLVLGLVLQRQHRRIECRVLRRPAQTGRATTVTGAAQPSSSSRSADSHSMAIRSCGLPAARFILIRSSIEATRTVRPSRYAPTSRPHRGPRSRRCPPACRGSRAARPTSRR